MKAFIIKFSVAIGFIIFILWVGINLPPTKAMKNSLLFAQIDKDELLKKTPSPRIVLIGGSNLSFGIDSKMIEDSLHINTINTAIEGPIGLKYMLRNALANIRPGDIAVVCPEYHQFYGNFADGESELLTMVFDVSPKTKQLLDARQRVTMLKFIPMFAASKLNPLNYLSGVNSTIGIYDRKSFNSHGDTYVHWTMAPQKVDPFIIKGDLDKSAFDALSAFREAIELKKAKFFLTFPPYQDASFAIATDKINTVEREFKLRKFELLGTPKRYQFPSAMIFNTPYHLARSGVTLRTNLLIADLKKAL